MRLPADTSRLSAVSARLGSLRLELHSHLMGRALPEAAIFRKENGAGDEIRTHDINLGKVALYP